MEGSKHRLIGTGYLVQWKSVGLHFVNGTQINTDASKHGLPIVEHYSNKGIVKEKSVKIRDSKICENSWAITRQMENGLPWYLP